jgi:hypothetical protein
LTTLFIAVLLVGFSEPARAQGAGTSQPAAYVLGQQLLADGSAFAKNFGLYQVSLDGTPNLLSADGENVSAFAIDQNAPQVAYAVAKDDSSVPRLIIRPLGPDSATTPGSTEIKLTGFSTVSSIQLFGSFAYVIGTDAQSKPQIGSIDTAKKILIKSRAMRLNDTLITVHNTGNWALASNASSSMALFSLPDLAQVNLPLKGYPGDIPSLAPEQANLQIVLADVPDPSKFGLIILDFATLKSARVEIPHFDKDTRLSAEWSTTGKFILYTAKKVAADGKITSTANTLITLAAKSALPLTYPDGDLSLVSWSPDDAFILFARNANGEDGARGFVVYDIAAQRFVAVKAPVTAVFTESKWSPTDHRLAMIGGSQALGQFSVFVTDSAFDASKATLTTKDPSLASSTLYWTPDGSSIIIATPPQTIKADSGKNTNVPGMLRTLNVSSGAFTRISPATLSTSPDIIVK